MGLDLVHLYVFIRPHMQGFKSSIFLSGWKVGFSVGRFGASVGTVLRAVCNGKSGSMGWI